MTTDIKVTSKSIQNRSIENSFSKNKSIKERYFEYCDSQAKIVWFLIPLMSLSAAIMPAGFVLMWSFDWYLAYVFFSVILFFGNIILNIAERNTRETISFYLFTIAFHVLSIVFSFMIFSL